MSRKIIYTAGPITSKSETKRWGYIMEARTMAQAIWATGHVAICPHLNTLYMGDVCIPNDDTFYKGDAEIIRRCVDALVMLPGWALSHGACDERVLAMQLNLPVYYHDYIQYLWEWLKREAV